MTPEDKLIQELRRKIKSLATRNAELEAKHQIDMAEIVRLRRMIENEVLK